MSSAAFSDREKIGGNFPPVVVPTEQSMLDDLQTRYPEVKSELAEMETALATYPDVIEDEETAKSLTDNLGKIGKLRKSWKAYRGDEKKPWNTIIGIIQNFFVTGEEKLEGWDTKYRPRLQVYQDKKKAEADAAREAELERQRVETARLLAQAEEAKLDALYAEALVELAEYDEAKARARAEEQERIRKEAQERADALAAQEKARADEKKKRDREERENNDTALKAIRRHMKDAEKLHTLAEADEANDDEDKTLDAIVRPGGMVSVLAGPVASSTLLDDDERTEIEGVRLRLNELRTGIEGRSNKRERTKREKARLAEEAADKVRANNRMWDDAYHELEMHDQRKIREAAQAEADLAREAETKAKGSIKDARAANRDASAGLRDAERDVRLTDKDAQRAENRTDRMAKNLENATDGGRVRGEFSAVSSQTGRWTHNILDDKALRAVCGPLGEHFTDDALSGAVYQWMVAHRDGFEGERVTDPALPGTIFIWERGLAIKA